MNSIEKHPCSTQMLPNLCADNKLPVTVQVDTEVTANNPPWIAVTGNTWWYCQLMHILVGHHCANKLKFLALPVWCVDRYPSTGCGAGNTNHCGWICIFLMIKLAQYSHLVCPFFSLFLTYHRPRVYIHKQKMVIKNLTYKVSHVEINILSHVQAWTVGVALTCTRN